VPPLDSAASVMHKVHLPAHVVDPVPRVIKDTVRIIAAGAEGVADMEGVTTRRKAPVTAGVVALLDGARSARSRAATSWRSAAAVSRACSYSYRVIAAERTCRWTQQQKQNGGTDIAGSHHRRRRRPATTHALPLGRCAK
jgi:hypothetical protein